MRRMTKPRRGGFTLVELLVVIAILALLATLATAAFLRSRSSEQVRASEATLTGLNVGLDARWKAVLDDAKDDMTKGRLDALIAWAGNDKDRALAIWNYLKLKNEFPTSIQEAANPVALIDPVTSQVIVSLSPKAVFRSSLKVNLTPPDTDPPRDPLPSTAVNVRAVDASRAADESATFFQWALTGSALRGQTFGGDGTANQTGELAPIRYQFTGAAGSNPSRLLGKSFKDAYGQPIAFVRLAYAAEVNAAPYARPGAPVGTGTVRVVPNDPLDPTGKLPTLVTYSGSGPEPPWHQGKLNAFWTAATSGHVGYQWALPNPPGGTGTFPAGVTWGYPFDVTTTGGVTILKPFNMVPTLMTSGEDKTFATGIGQGDDLMGFRLRREGNKGN